MLNLSVRGVDPATVAELKARAQKEGGSVNALVLRLIDEGLGVKPAKPLRRRYDDLDALAGSWSRAEVEAFEAAVVPFQEIDKGLWK